MKLGIALAMTLGSVPALASPLVVLDPGHGGSNAGAKGAVPSLHEKQLTLAIATQVAAKLRDHGISVELTRTDDRTLTLRQRVEHADHVNADLFVSIHANASPTRTQRGYETYVLTTKGVDVDARALRAESMTCLLYTSPSPRDGLLSRMPSSA